MNMEKDGSYLWKDAEEEAHLMACETTRLLNSLRVRVLKADTTDNFIFWQFCHDWINERLTVCIVGRHFNYAFQPPNKTASSTRRPNFLKICPWREEITLVVVHLLSPGLLLQHWDLVAGPWHWKQEKWERLSLPPESCSNRHDDCTTIIMENSWWEKPVSPNKYWNTSKKRGNGKKVNEDCRCGEAESRQTLKIQSAFSDPFESCKASCFQGSQCLAKKNYTAEAACMSYLQSWEEQQ